MLQSFVCHVSAGPRHAFRAVSVGLSAAACSLLVVSCGAAAPGSEDLCISWLPGDLVITELLVDPEGVDTGREYIELFNSSERTLALGGLTLYAVADAERRVTLGDAQVPPRGYFVLAHGGIQPPRSDVGSTYGDGFGALMNARGVIGLRCGSTIIDEVTYGRTQPGHARELDGAFPPDAVANDNEAAWCDAETAIAGSEDFGTPGAANRACGRGVTRVCADPVTGVLRPAQSPGPGDLVITEVLPRPAASAASDGEWFEVYAARDLDLNGLTVRTGSTGVLASDRCLHVAKGAYAVIGRRAEKLENGGLSGVSAIVAVRLADSDGTLAVYDGATLVDEIRWAASQPGVALQLDPARLSASDNDDPKSFCPAVDLYGSGDRGTPAAANRPCPPAGDPDRCVDAQTGLLRRTVKPAPGDLRISEIMADPAAVPDADGEWIEIAASKAIDLNGIVLAAGTARHTITSDGCLRAEAGQHLLMARSSEPDKNGGLPAVMGALGLGLPNGSGSVALENELGALDTLSWSSVKPGVALQRDPVDVSWVCDATSTFGTTLTDKGTPGAANTGCARAGAPPIPAGEDTCFDGAQGAIRATNVPSVGDLVITEIMADPAAVADAAGEWLEIFVARGVDLNGVQIGTESASATVVTSTACAPVAAGTFLLFARGLDPAENGGLPGVTADFGFALPNTGSAEVPRAILVRHKDRAIDRATYISTQPGVSMQLSANRLDASSNDVAASWCLSPSRDAAGQPIHRFGAGDAGTPAAPNELCP